MSKLIIKRIDQADGSLRKFTVLCDGKRIGHLTYLEEKEFEMETGTHIISVAMFPYKSQEYEIRMEESSIGVKLYVGFIYSNIFTALLPGALKLLPEDEFLEIYHNEAEQDFKKRVKHHQLVAASGLIASAIFIYLIWQFHTEFVSPGWSALLALGMAMGAIQLFKRNWIISKSFFMNKPLYDAITMVFIVLIFGVNQVMLMISGLAVAILFMALWVFLRRHYAT